MYAAFCPQAQWESWSRSAGSGNQFHELPGVPAGVPWTELAGGKRLTGKLVTGGRPASDAASGGFTRAS